MLSPPPSTCQSPSSNMYSTCRALQSLLANNLPTLSPTPKPTRAPPPPLGSPIVLATGPRAQPKKQKSHAVQNNSKITKSHPRTPPRSNLKRRRSFSSDTEDAPLHIPSTPKRQRLCPPTLPLGLDRTDFAALSSTPIASSTPPHTPAQNAPPYTPSRQTTPHHARQEAGKEDQGKDVVDNEKEAEKEDRDNGKDIEKETEQEETWSTPSDSALVSLILNKLRLRQSDWDECARTLGKQSDSLGRRWKCLLGDGAVGLRRGTGERVRGEVGMVFGPLLRLQEEVGGKEG